jgi:two-component system chemotaxis response regulator CheV
MAKAQNQPEILLESGTNELEVMEFTIAGNTFGINVAKVNEIMPYPKVIPMPNAHPNIEGVFKRRDEIITVIDLPGYLNLGGTDVDTDRQMIIVTNFNKTESAFHVHSVVEIHRISWKEIEKPDNAIYGGQEGLATGIFTIKGKLVTIIDFEKILFDISPASGIQLSEIHKLGIRERNEKPVLFAEDSQLLEAMVMEALNQSGYTNVICCNNGQEAYDKLCEWRNTGDVTEFCRCIITDIEMPQMDGHRLTKLVKEDPKMKMLPVIIFSSLIDEAMYEKGVSLGADAQLTKPEIGNLVKTVDKFIL